MNRDHIIVGSTVATLMIFAPHKLAAVAARVVVDVQRKRLAKLLRNAAAWVEPPQDEEGPSA